MTAPPSRSALKAALRTDFLSARDALTEASYREKSHAICEAVRNLDEPLQADVVHLYWPLTQRREVDTRPLIDWLYLQKKQIVLPAISTFRAAERRMHHRLYRGRSCLKPNRWGILEPEGGPDVPIEALDVVVVPALGAGRNGHRIGHGFGYYDAFLAEVTVPRICLVYDSCLVEAVPAEDHDVPMTMICTESEVVRTEAV